MDYKKLEQVNSLLSWGFADYQSMIAVGSIAAGDPWIEGRSDRDILLVFNCDPQPRINSIQEILRTFEFDDTYHFTSLPRNDFGQADSKYAFSNVFRSKTLFGQDIIPSAQLPDRQTVQETYTCGLGNVRKKLGDIIANWELLSEGDIRDRFWKQFKNTFRYLAIKVYFETGDYPVRREDLVRRLNAEAIHTAFTVLHSIDSQPKETIVETGREVLRFLDELSF